MKTEEDVRVGVQHPLDPLTAAEIEAASGILKRDRGLAETARFVYVTLKEPSKDAVLSYRSGEAFEREAHIVLRERAERRTYEAVVSITAGEVRLWREVPGVQPAVMLEEFLATEATVKKDARWQEAMRRRGVTDFDNVMIDPWSVGYNGPQDAAGQGRFIRPLTWVRQGDPDDTACCPSASLTPTPSGGPSSRPSTYGSPRTTLSSDSRRATTPTSTPAATACPRGPRPTGRWKTPTWCSGTRSPRTTWSARRTGR